MKILLLNAPPFKELGVTGQMYPPLGIMYLASYSRKHYSGLQIQVLDGYKEDRKKLVDRINRFDPDILGISFTTQAARGAFSFVNEFREINSKAVVVAGGAHPTAFPEDCFNKSKLDLIVLGEGEITFLEILKSYPNFDNLENFPGIAYKKNGHIYKTEPRGLIKNLDEIPFPARDLLDITQYSGHHYKKMRFDTDIISGRGCPFNCVYCSNPVWKLQKPWFRLRSPMNVVDEMQEIIDYYGIYEIFDETDEFNGNIKWAKDVCDEIIKRNINISWKAQMRVDHVDEELVSKLKDSGFWLALFGLESANDRTLKGINKKQTLNQMESALTLMKNKNIKCFGLFMAFNVWEEKGILSYEDKEASLNTFRYIKKLLRESKIDLFGWSMTTPYPGSNLYNIAIKHKLIPDDKIDNWELFDSGSNFVMELPTVSKMDWKYVHIMGKILQAKLLLKSGLINRKSFFVYIKKIISLIKGLFRS